jgi:hypothetical protein
MWHGVLEWWGTGVLRISKWLSFKSFCCTSFQHSSTSILHKCGARDFQEDASPRVPDMLA